MPARTTVHQHTARDSLLEWAILGGLLAVAAWLRLYHLGALGLEIDEGVHALAVEGWMTDGIPVLPSGAVYQRSLPFVALQVIAARFVGLNEFALRLPAALFGVAAVAATYALARGMFDRRVAVIAAAFMALSAWEIELSRYARFYTAFQFTFVVAFLCLYRMLAAGARVWTFGFVAASLAAVTLHELAIVIAVCFLIPLFERDASFSFRAKSVAGGAIFVGAWLAYRRFAGPWIVSMAPSHGLERVYSTEPAGARILPFLPSVDLPDLSPIRDVLANPASGFHVLLLAGTTALWFTLRRNPMREGALLAIAIAAGIMKLFMMSALALLAWFVWFGQTGKDVLDSRLRPVLVALGVSLGFWIVSLWDGAAGWRSLLLALFGFPRILEYFLYWLAMGWPILLLAITLACAMMLVRYFRTWDRALLYLPVGLVIPVVLASFFITYEESRYIFHLYPLLIVAFSWGCVRLAERLSAGSRGLRPAATLVAVATVGMLASRDVGALTVASLTRTYGDKRDVMRSVISWPVFGRFHQDQVGAATYVDEHKRAGDRVVAIGLPHQLNVYRFYAGQLDAALTRIENASYQRRQGDRLVDWVTGAQLFTGVREMLDTGGTTTWLIADAAIISDEAAYFPPHVREEARAYAAGAGFRGRDGVTYVVKLP